MNTSVLDFVDKRTREAVWYTQLNPCLGEVIGARFMHRLGIGCPTEIKIANSDDIASADGDWIVKTLVDGRLRFGGSGDRGVLVRKIPHAISLTSLFALYLIDSDEPRYSVPEGYRGDADVTRLFLHFKLEKIPNPATFFDFVLPADRSALMAAIQWNSPEMVKILGARLLLNTTCPTRSNILVDSDARLYSIDHEHVRLSDDFAEIKMLAEHLDRSSKTWAALSSIGKQLDGSDVEYLFHDLPEALECSDADVKRMVDHYKLRLRYWQALFS